MIRNLFKTPTFSHSSDNIHYFQNNRKSEIWEFEPLDIESTEIEKIQNEFSSIIKQLKPEERLSFSLKKTHQNIYHDENNTRANSIKTLGFSNYQGRIFLDSPISKTNSSHDLSSLKGVLKLKPITDYKSEDFDFRRAQIVSLKTHLDLGSKVIGAIRIYKQSEILDSQIIAEIIAHLDYGTEIFTGISKVSDTRAESRLRTLRTRQTNFGDLSKVGKVDTINEVLNELNLNSDSLINIEQIILIEADSIPRLRQKMTRTLALIESFGESMIENFGVGDAFFSAKPGGTESFSFQDLGKNVASFLPIFTFKSNESSKGKIDRSLILHRPDNTLHYFDVFNPKYKAFNVITVGTTGSGKSVLTNLFTKSVLNDPNVEVIKIDVGGSYKKECETLNGVEFELSVDHPTGLNPFSHLREYGSSKSYLEFLTHFLCELIKEVDELEISKELRAKVESAVLQYQQLNPKNPSITDFYKNIESIPRRDLIRRWTKGNQFEHIFNTDKRLEELDSGDSFCRLEELQQSKQIAKSAEHSSAPNTRYSYLNFKSILGAGSKDLSQAIMAAVILELNMKILKAGDRFQNPDGKRIVLICDETKFFLERNMEFFLFTVSNFRKLGHGSFIINQDLNNFIITRKDGIKDNSLINNSPTRFFLQADYEEAILRHEFNLSDYQIDRILKNPYKGKEFRELVLQDDIGTRVCRLRLTPEEYLEASSSTEDNEKISKLVQFIPGLTIQEAIQCLGLRSLY